MGSAMGCAGLAISMAALLLPHRCESVWTWKHACLRFASRIINCLAPSQLRSLSPPALPPSLRSGLFLLHRMSGVLVVVMLTWFLAIYTTTSLKVEGEVWGSTVKILCEDAAYGGKEWW